jgi:phage terminase Nu1 subunit (DNA packaging protein)
MKARAVTNGLVTRRELALHFRVSRETISSWERLGCPVVHRGSLRSNNPSRYSMKAVAAWRAGRGQVNAVHPAHDLAVARARQSLADALLKEQLREVRSGDLLPRREVEARWGAEVARIRAKLLACPVAYAERLHKASTGGIAAMEHALMLMIREVLAELAEPEAGAG